MYSNDIFGLYYGFSALLNQIICYTISILYRRERWKGKCNKFRNQDMGWRPQFIGQTDRPVDGFRKVRFVERNNAMLILKISIHKPEATLWKKLTSYDARLGQIENQ